MESVDKLVEAIEKHSNVEIGNVCVGLDGQKYRHDQYILKYPTTAYWLIKLFDKAALEVKGRSAKVAGRSFQTDTISFYCEKAKFKGQQDGKISMSKLILL